MVADVEIELLHTWKYLVTKIFDRSRITFAMDKRKDNLNTWTSAFDGLQDSRNNNGCWWSTIVRSIPSGWIQSKVQVLCLIKRLPTRPLNVGLAQIGCLGESSVELDKTWK